MEVQIGPETEERLNRLALERGSDAESLAKEAIERFVDYDEWFTREVEKGIAAADRGELVSQEEVGARLKAWLTEKTPRT